ncbi:AAA family ATPase [Mycolicibacterium boenickei]|uniref:AAA family ATPase n=1 Tax=Mycolicibacterium boenickei TaxID=146017 RepID=A0ABM7IWY2_9MYCO|nr:AAA family ATPase [Mycolicibacterium boenickei]BBX91362.1 hypothetical protein MBOE_30110 [Mycolicibacterium boenickei]
MATGNRWQGRETVRRKVLYVVAEGAFGFKGRLNAWESGWGTAIYDEWFHVLPVPVNLTRPLDVGNLEDLIQWEGYGLVVLDTLARCMVGGEENSAKDTGVVVDAMTKLRRATPDGRGVVLGLHHAGKDAKTLRGSSAFEGGVDTVCFTARDERFVSLAREKRRDGPELDTHLFEFDPIPATGSGVLKQSHGLGETYQVENEAVATLSLIMSQHFSLTGATHTQLFDMAVESGRMARATFYRAKSDLLKAGRIINTGTDKRPFYQLSDSKG